MRKSLFILFLLGLVFKGEAQDTFSIVAVDPATGEVGAAGASCVDGAGAFGGIIDIISGIIPGRGGVNSQAYVCIPNGNLQNALDQMQAGASPSEIIDFLLANDAFPCSSSFSDPSYRQYGIADLDPTGAPRTAGWSGSNTDDYKDDIQGATYSVQGNILLNATVLENMEANFNGTSGSLADKLMAAMQGANFAGADSRCLARGTSSTTAFLQVYRADDSPGSPYLRLNIDEMPFGEEPIDSLQALYDQFLSVPENALDLNLRIYPNPADQFLIVNYNKQYNLDSVIVFDMNGKRLNLPDQSEPIAGERRLDVSSLSPGVYFMKIESEGSTQTLTFIKS